MFTATKGDLAFRGNVKTMDRSKTTQQYILGVCQLEKGGRNTWYVIEYTHTIIACGLLNRPLIWITFLTQFSNWMLKLCFADSTISILTLHCVFPFF